MARLAPILYPTLNTSSGGSASAASSANDFAASLPFIRSNTARTLASSGSPPSFALPPAPAAARAGFLRLSSLAPGPPPGALVGAFSSFASVLRLTEIRGSRVDRRPPPRPPPGRSSSESSPSESPSGSKTGSSSASEVAEPSTYVSRTTFSTPPTRSSTSTSPSSYTTLLRTTGSAASAPSAPSAPSELSCSSMTPEYHSSIARQKTFTRQPT